MSNEVRAELAELQEEVVEILAERAEALATAEDCARRLMELESIGQSLDEEFKLKELDELRRRGTLFLMGRGVLQSQRDAQAVSDVGQHTDHDAEAAGELAALSVGKSGPPPRKLLGGLAVGAQTQEIRLCIQKYLLAYGPTKLVALCRKLGLPQASIYYYVHCPLFEKGLDNTVSLKEELNESGGRNP